MKTQKDVCASHTLTLMGQLPKVFCVHFMLQRDRGTKLPSSSFTAHNYM